MTTVADREPPAVGEIDEVGSMTAAEERFERIRQTTGLFLGPLLFAVVWSMSFPSLSPEAHKLAAVVTLVVTWWITEAIPIPATAMLGASLTALLGVSTAREAFAPFATPVIFLFIGAFIIGQAITVHGLDRRIAAAVLSTKGIQGDLNRIRLALGVLCVCLSAWLSNTATTAMLAPMALGILSTSGALARSGSRKFTSGFLLVIAYGAGIGGIITPVGTPPNLITIGYLEELAGVRINFITWMMMALPFSVVIGTVMMIMIHFLFPRAEGMGSEVERVAPAPAPAAGPLTRGQRYCLLAFGTAVVLWVTPGIYALLGPDAPGRSLVGRLDEGVSAILAASLLFFLPLDWARRKFAMTWSEAGKIDWGTILLFGGGLSLGEQMFRTGLAEQIGLSLVAFTGADSLWTITALAIGLGIVITELTSNTATANMVVPVVISIAQAAGVSPVPPALGACLAASMAFMLPISMPANAIVYGTGYIRITEMIKFGVILDFLCFFIILAGLRIICPLLGLM